jgi:hypothetical protein
MIATPTSRSAHHQPERSLDSAFLRRIRFIVELLFPGLAARSEYGKLERP